MAIPMSARARAGASWVSSPTMATRWPASRSSAIASCLSSGSPSAPHSSVPCSCRDRGGHRMVPGERHDLADTVGAEGVDDFPYLRTDLVAQAEQSDQAQRSRQQQRRLGVGPKSFHPALGLGRDAELLGSQELGSTQQQRPPSARVRLPGHQEPGHRWGRGHQGVRTCSHSRYAGGCSRPALGRWPAVPAPAAPPRSAHRRIPRIWPGFHLMEVTH